MRKVAFLLLAFIGLNACTNNDGGDNDTSITDDTTKTVVDTSTINTEYYKCYTGTIADVPVVLNLIKTGKQYNGTYYYNNIGNVLHVYGAEMLDSNGMITFWEDAPTDREEHTGPKWEVSINDDVINGKWISADAVKVYDINLKEDYTQAIRLGIVSTSDSVKYIDSLPQPIANCQLQFIMPIGDDKYAKYIAKAMGDLLVCPTANKADYIQCLNKKKESYFSTYLADMKDAEAQGLLTESYSFNFSWTENQNVIYNSDGWLCICTIDWQYTGGAHGNYNSIYNCIDAKTEHIWTLKDIIANTNKLVPLIDKDVRKQFSLTDGQALNSRLFVDEMYATNNFFITDKGITFVYTSYEIASYADGEVNVFIPFAKLTKWLTPEFKARMNIVDNQNVKS